MTTPPAPTDPARTGLAAAAPAPALDARLVVERGGFSLDLALNAASGEVVALLGPNGAGKTTALRALAGLAPLTGGHLRLDGEVLEDPGARVRVPTERRPVGVVFQDYLLFPHLSALDNVAFGLRAHGRSKAEARAHAHEWLDRVGLAAHARSRPRALSGGQAQRVALARALAPRPRLLLLDEPMAALDARTRLEVRTTLRRHLAAFEAVAVLVTHDPLDAMVLADRLVVLEHGRAVQEGAPADIARHPRSDYIARLVGLNLFRGTAHGHDVTLDRADGAEGADGELVLTAADAGDGPVFAAFPPAAVTVHRTRPDTSARNQWPVTVLGMERHGDQVRLDLSGPLRLTADLTPASVADLGISEGSEVWAAVKASQTRAYPA
ncbi:ABC transporter ATP-binding protein [Streptacidiphilus jiangxiensis]|uniref:Molybdate transport system ATP-binding protein n=1 Tax=Streptacidiphilus jiangxiensis TaxID=235985 RepID=A0A1H7HTZ0_STRJI|nr:ABC transporter ATP-binding protein [Streptacidiphilus jiangxiensis]SEK53761.1 molybdate transport system ATP-binding protein [Streptacidiphilus jiangxiensis]